MQPIPNRTRFIMTGELLDAYEDFFLRERAEYEALGLSVEEQELRLADSVREYDRLREDWFRMQKEIREWRKAHET